MENKRKLKEKVCITLDPDLHSFAREKGFNLSRFLENALKRLKMNLTDESDSGQNANNADLVLICQNKLENRVPSAGIEPATYRSSAGFRMSPDSDLKPKMDLDSNSKNFSGHAYSGLISARADIQFPIYVDGKELRGIPGCTPAEWFAGREKAFDEWHNRGKRARDKNTQTYINTIKRMDYLLIPDDWIGRRLTVTEKNAFDLMYSFFNSIHHTGMKFNGYDRVDWNEARKDTITTRGTRAKTVIKDATIEEAFRHCQKIKAKDKEKENACKVFYTLLLYSGARVSQLYQFYDDLEHDRVVLDPNDYTEKHVSELIEELKDCIRFNVRYIGFNHLKNRESSKRTTYYYFPNELKNAALNYRNPFTYSKLCSVIGVSEQ